MDKVQVRTRCLELALDLARINNFRSINADPKTFPASEIVKDAEKFEKFILNSKEFLTTSPGFAKFEK